MQCYYAHVCSSHVSIRCNQRLTHFRSAHAAQECNHVEFLPINGMCEGRLSSPAGMRTLVSDGQHRARTACSAITHTSAAATSAFAPISILHTSTRPCKAATCRGVSRLIYEAQSALIKNEISGVFQRGMATKRGLLFICRVHVSMMIQ
jgi:hypothetical protein